MKRYGIAGIAALLLAWPTAVFSAGAVSKPVLHLLAPSDEFAGQYDPLATEAAMRLLVIDLAVSGQQYARFWPVDQLGQLPADAFPQVVAALGGKGNIADPTRKDTVGGERTNPEDPSHRVTVQLVSATGENRTIAEGSISVATWEQLVRSTEQLAKALRTGAAQELRAAPVGALRSAPATKPQLEILAQARQMALSVASGKVLRASRMVDGILNESPTCAEAHYTAALCGAVLACQDLSGSFHERGRYLAGPLAHLLFAERLAKPERAEDRLAEAWVMLACGYPNAARNALKALPEAPPQQPEARALQMFITRDYRPLTPQTVLKAEPIEQLAWMWAAQQCGRDDLLQGAPAQMAVRARTCALLPLYPTHQMGVANTPLAMALAYARDANDLLLETDIPAARRTELGRRIAAAMRLPLNDEAGKLAQTVALSTLKDGVGDLAETGPPLLDLYAAAMSVPPGPVVAGNQLAWRSIGAHDFAELERGLFVLTVFEEADFFGAKLGDTAGTERFCRQAEEGLRGLPDAAPYFEAVRLHAVNKLADAKACMLKALKTRFGQRPCAVYRVAQGFGSLVANKEVKDAVTLSAGRGSWEWTMMTVASGSGFVTREFWNIRRVIASGKLALSVDDYASPVLRPLFRMETLRKEAVETILARMPYDVSTRREIAWCMTFGYYKDVVASEKLYREIIETVPGDIQSYFQLAEMLAAQGQLNQAVEVGKLAGKNCGPSVALSNLQGRVAVWLTQLKRSDEALEWGKKAAVSGSATGLAGLAKSLEDNKKPEEAYNVYRSLAYRYENGISSLFYFMVRNKYPADAFVKETEGLLKAYPGMSAKVHNEVRGALMAGGAAPEVLEQLYAGPLSFVAPKARASMLMLVAIHARRFDKAIACAAELQKLRPLEPLELLWLHAAMRLGGKTEHIKEVETELGKCTNNPEYAWHIRYVLKQASLKDTESCVVGKTGIPTLCWLKGIDAELRHDVREAIEQYRKAEEMLPKSESFTTGMCFAWVNSLEGESKTGPTAKAGSGQAPPQSTVTEWDKAHQLAIPFTRTRPLYPSAWTDANQVLPVELYEPWLKTFNEIVQKNQFCSRHPYAPLEGVINWYRGRADAPISVVADRAVMNVHGERGVGGDGGNATIPYGQALAQEVYPLGLGFTARDGDLYVTARDRLLLWSLAPTVQYDPNEWRPVETALRKPLSLDLRRERVDTALGLIQKETGVTIQPDYTNPYWPPHMLPLTLRVQAMEARYALAWICHLRGLSYTVKGGKIIVSTPDAILALSQPGPREAAASGPKKIEIEGRKPASVEPGLKTGPAAGQRPDGLKWSDRAQRVRDRMNESVSVELVEAPLEEAVQSLCRAADITAHIDGASLLAVRTLHSDKVTLRLQQAKVGDALSSICAACDMAYAVNGDTVLVAHKSVLPDMMRDNQQVCNALKKRLTFEVTNTAILSVLQKIRDKANVSFMSDGETLGARRPQGDKDLQVTFRASGMQTGDVIERVCQSLGLRYEIMGGWIYISKRSEP